MAKVKASVTMDQPHWSEEKARAWASEHTIFDILDRRIGEWEAVAIKGALIHTGTYLGGGGAAAWWRLWTIPAPKTEGAS